VKRVLVITNNLNQASFRLRMQALIQPLFERGWELDVKVRPRGRLSRRRLLRSAADYDATILQRKLLDGFDARLLERCARRVFFDVDDAVMHCRKGAGPVDRWRSWRRFVATAHHVDHVVAGNRHLAELFNKQGAATSVLPTVVDMQHYQVKTHASTAKPTLVWIGSRSTLRYLSQFSSVLGQAASGAPGLRLVVIADEPLASPPMPTEFVPWSVETEAAALCRGDIGIAPTPEDPWTQGKCGFKIVQYMAAGLPVVASPVGSNAELVVDGQTGFLPKQPGDWPAAIIALARDVDLRRRMGAAGRERAEREYSLSLATDFWVSLLQVQ
jgi:glycosyltransferase involved in cell wall biosynthesis